MKIFKTLAATAVISCCIVNSLSASAQQVGHRSENNNAGNGYRYKPPSYRYDSSSSDSNPRHGYRYNPSVWGKGIGFEVAKLVLKFGIKDLKFQKIYALSHIENYGSIRILEKLNFERQDMVVINSQHAILFVLKVERN